jgi:hypothetical protein
MVARIQCQALELVMQIDPVGKVPRSAEPGFEIIIRATVAFFHGDSIILYALLVLSLAWLLSSHRWGSSTSSTAINLARATSKPIVRSTGAAFGPTLIAAPTSLENVDRSNNYCHTQQSVATSLAGFKCLPLQEGLDIGKLTSTL